VRYRRMKQGDASAAPTSGKISPTPETAPP
jgi:hypothetical protein